ncbi:hypothetical protein BDP27DRAFT_1376140 [Rhodocollybia butyracea]|uniref:Secreted protein n=1 Tax=Rhodocollybia butyracea TaxID=206335 RepID=A0A9P5TVW7_9AGAR|nr:hypothetical protein BDP27DRAFT_1376140 [Rhodocollybia butyracea]
MTPMQLLLVFHLFPLTPSQKGMNSDLHMPLMHSPDIPPPPPHLGQKPSTNLNMCLQTHKKACTAISKTWVNWSRCQAPYSRFQRWTVPESAGKRLPIERALLWLSGKCEKWPINNQTINTYH